MDYIEEKKNDDISTGSALVVHAVRNKEENFVDEIELALFSTLNEKAKTAMQKLLEKIAFIYCVLNVDLNNLAKKHDEGAEEDIMEKMSFVLEYPLYNLKRNRSADNSDYDLFASEDMTGMVKMPRDVTKPGAHDHVFCSSLQFALCYKALVSEFREERTSIDEDHEESESEC